MKWIGKMRDVEPSLSWPGNDELSVARGVVTATVDWLCSWRGRRISRRWAHAAFRDRPSARFVLSIAGIPLLSVYRADTWLQRLKGLFAYAPLDSDQALWLSPCSAVHTIGMRYTIDVAFLDDYGTVLKLVMMKPWSVQICSSAHSVLEMAGGTAIALNLQVGQCLAVEQVGVHE